MNTLRQDVSSEVLHTLEEWARVKGLNTQELKDRFNGLSPRDERVIPNILDRLVIACYMERIEAAWSIRLTPGANQYIKCDDKAREFRLKGDENFAVRRYQDALLAYTQALRFASFERTLSTEGNEFVLAYSSRSKLLAHCEQYSLALSDIKMALKYGCPQVELEERRKLCEEKLAAQKKSSDEDADEEDRREEISATLADLKLDQAIASAAPSPPSSSSATVTPKGPIEIPEDVEPALGEVSPLIPAVSVKVVETSDDKKGRGLFTTERVRFGEILAKESPYAHTLFIDCFDDYCQACCKPLEGHTIPCPGCTVVQYCSRECKKADKVHWKYTCHPQLPHIYDPLIQLMLRIICRSFMPEIRSPPSSKTKPSKLGGSDKPGPLNGPEIITNNYSSFRKLCHPPKASQDYILLSIYVGLCVRKMFYSLKNNQGVIIPKLGILIPHIFLHFHRLLVNKVFIVSQEEPITITTSPNTINENGDKIGYAIYNSVAMFNHDCLPNCFLFFYGPKAVIRASRSIEAGEELSICYGPSYASDTYSDRQRKLLEWYYFKCECGVCKSKATAPRICYKCPKCTKPLVVNEDESHSCAQCDITDAIKEGTITIKVMSDTMTLEPGASRLVSAAITELERGRIIFEKGDYDEAVTILSKAYNTLDDYLYRSNHALVRARAYLSECLTAMGHHRMAAKLMAVNVNVTGEIYGWESIEYVCIMIPYLNLMYKDIEDIWEDGDRESVKSKGAKVMALIEEQIDRINRLTKLVDPNANPLTVFALEMKNLEGIREQTQTIITHAENSPQ